MGQLDSFLVAGKAADSTASTPAATAAATDVKPVETAPVVASAAPAASAGQALEKPEGAAAKPEGEVAKPDGTEQVRDDKTGRFKADEQMVPLSALQQERQRRQAAERAGQQQEAPKKNFWDDPEGVIKEQVDQVRVESKSRFYDLCEERAKEKHDNFDEVVNIVMEEAQSDETLGRHLFELVDGARDPAEALYRFSVNRREMRAVGGDLEKYKDSIAKPLRDELKTLQASYEALKTQLDNLSKVPNSLSATPSATRGDLAADQAVTRKPLSEIVKPRKRA
jgi:hypothetical protein